MRFRLVYVKVGENTSNATMADHHQLAGGGADSLGSPTHMAMTGHDLSAEEIQDLLGVMGGAHDGDADNDHHSASPLPSASGSVSAPASGTEISSEAKAQARTERKRSREKQRRVDVNNQFNQLSEVLRGLESKHSASLETRPPLAPSNRADLIARVVLLLQDLDKMVDKGTKEREDLQNELERSQKAGEETAAKLKESLMAPQNMGQNRVMMMVPMMIQGDQAAAMGFGGMTQTAMPVAASAPVSSSET